VFYDENAVEFYDDKHSEWEDSFSAARGECDFTTASHLPLL